MPVIKNKTLSMAEVIEYSKKTEDGETDIRKFIRKFIKLTPEKAKKFRKKLEELDLMKIKSDHISKIIDLLPENQEDLNKIFVGVSLNEEETKKILETVKEFK